MAVRAHLICKHGALVEAIKPREAAYSSGDWDISEEDARRLVHGTLYFHQAKATRSYFGGTVTGYEMVETENKKSLRVRFFLTATQEAKGVPWQGRDDDMAWFSGVIAG